MIYNNKSIMLVVVVIFVALVVCHAAKLELTAEQQAVIDRMTRDLDEAEAKMKQQEQDLSEKDRALLNGPNPCDKVLPNVGWTLEGRKMCQEYDQRPYIQPDCTNQKDVVPKIFHSVGKDPEESFVQLNIVESNPGFTRNHQGDAGAYEYVQKHCGADVAAAYACMAPPAYRGDIFKFCALYAQGGVYLDGDLAPLVPLTDLYSPCSSATIGWDIPQGDHFEIEGKQMKILASQPGAALFKCALDTIVHTVRHRIYPDKGDLAVTGPLMLHECYVQFPQDVAITYHDTRGAMWPYTGIRRHKQVLAYEMPAAKHFGLGLGEDYGIIFKDKTMYRASCALFEEGAVLAPL